MIGSGGLTTLTTPQLQLLLRALHRGELPCPIDRVGLATVGLLHLGDELEALRGLEANGVRAVLISVLAERRRLGR
jgi:hypothetical protein